MQEDCDPACSISACYFTSRHRFARWFLEKGNQANQIQAEVGETQPKRDALAPIRLIPRLKKPP